ncbi:DNA repair protein XRCC4 isoform X2 [Quercus robur]|uniref:DNA repair protein XRCC4 isoform X2 n=1 Tax=Quercus robur TaxID=38942 RepID=UPI0021619B92|nr:DNA repair protein XRCC4 isoform X2 [Quercus robur]
MEEERHTCLKLVPQDSDPIFVKGTWFPSHFHLSITDGLHTWICHASQDDVRDRAALWDQPVSDYVLLAERYLGFQQPGSVYRFTDAGDSNKREEVVRKTQSFEMLKVEAEKCLAQSERINKERVDFESEIYAKFLGVLNSKKAKLRDLRDQISNKKAAGKLPEEEEEGSTDKTESFDDGSDNETSEEEPAEKVSGTSKDILVGKPRGRKRIARI